MAQARPATAVYVLFNTSALDLAWIPESAPVVLVHNDDSFDVERCQRPNVVHVRPGANVGFGAGVNVALPCVTTDRVVLVNPDTVLTREHWDALVTADEDEVVTIPLLDADGTPTVVIRRHYTPLTLVLTAWRIGRLLKVRRRGAVSPLGAPTSSQPARSVWASGACVSLPSDRLRTVGGFDQRYFLYFEDADLGRRLANRFPDLTVRLASVEPGIHQVGGTATGKATATAHASSATLYARQATGWSWRVAETLVSLRHRLVAHARSSS